MTSHELANILLAEDDLEIYARTKIVDSVGEVQLEISKINDVVHIPEKDGNYFLVLAE